MRPRPKRNDLGIGSNCIPAARFLVSRRRSFFVITIRIKNEHALYSLRKLAVVSRRLPGYVVNKFCRESARRAYDTMPAVSASRIQSELEVSRYGVTKGGKLSKAKKPRNVAIGSHESTLASRIVLARLWMPNIYTGFGPEGSGGLGRLPGYNVFTGGVFRLEKPATKGKAEFLQWLETRSAMMVKARSQATGFYRLCADVIWHAFNAAVSKSPVARTQTGGGAALSGGGKVSKRIGIIAGAELAASDATTARASFWVGGTTPQEHKGQDDALFRIALPVWQRAIDAEAAGTIVYAEKLYAEAARESGLDMQ